MTNKTTNKNGSVNFMLPMLLLSLSLLALSVGCNCMQFRQHAGQTPPTPVPAESHELREVAEKLGVRISEGSSDVEVKAEIDKLFLDAQYAPEESLSDAEINEMCGYLSPEQAERLRKINAFARNFKGRRALALP